MVARLLLLFLTIGIAAPGYAETIDSRPIASLVAVRLGTHSATTRIVLDFAGSAPEYQVALDPAGQTLSLSLVATGVTGPPALPRGGLVAGIGLQPQSEGTRLQFALTQPVQLVAQGELPPNAVYRHYRVYLDLVAMATVPVAVPERMTERPIEPAPQMSEARPEPHPEPESQETHQEAPEPASTHVKLGAAGDRSFKGGRISKGPSAALQTGILADRFEIEASGTALFEHGHPEWKTGLLLKKPIELTPQFEAEIGLGPSWLRKTAGEHPGDSLGAEAVGELVLWGNVEKSFGWYVEGSYGRDFGKGHESGAGFGTGLLIAVP